MVEHEFLEVLARTLKLKYQNDGLLTPVSCLKEIVCLEYSFVRLVRIAFEHGCSPEIPQDTSFCVLHHIKAEWSKDTEVHGSIYLLHESGLFVAIANSSLDGHRLNDSLHHELSGEAEKDDVERDEREIVSSLCIHIWSTGIVGAFIVGEEDGVMEDVVFSWIQEIPR